MSLPETRVFPSIGGSVWLHGVPFYSQGEGEGEEKLKGFSSFPFTPLTHILPPSPNATP